MPAFSIVTAIRDGLDYFKETAPTLLSQTEKDWEWIIVDDCSAEPVQSYVKGLNDPRIRLLSHDQPKGQTPGLNWGIREAKSQWIVRMDGDDLAAPNRLERLREEIRDHSRLLFSDYKVIDQSGQEIETIQYQSPPGAAFYEYFEKRNNPICHPTVAFYKFRPNGDVYQYDEKLRNAQDYGLWKAIYADQPHQPFTHVKDALIDYRVVSSSLSGERAREQKAELQAIRNSGEGAEISKVQYGKKLTLNDREKIGMNAYRTLYYRLIGSGPRGGKLTMSDLDLLVKTMGYPSILPKSVFYLAGRLFRKRVKESLFKGIYQ